MDSRSILDQTGEEKQYNLSDLIARSGYSPLRDASNGSPPLYAQNASVLPAPDINSTTTGGNVNPSPEPAPGINEPPPEEPPAASGPKQPPPPAPPAPPAPATETPESSASAPSPTSNKNAVVDREREARGLPAMMAPLKRTFGEAWESAMQTLDADPSAAERLAAELREHPRPVSDVENAMLLHRRVTLATNTMPRRQSCWPR